MPLYPARALERAMKIREVITRAMSGKITWIETAEIVRIYLYSLRRGRNVRLDWRPQDGICAGHRTRRGWLYDDGIYARVWVSAVWSKNSKDVVGTRKTLGPDPIRPHMFLGG